MILIAACLFICLCILAVVLYRNAGTEKAPDTDNSETTAENKTGGEKDETVSEEEQNREKIQGIIDNMTLEDYKVDRLQV